MTEQEAIERIREALRQSDKAASVHVWEAAIDRNATAAWNEIKAITHEMSGKQPVASKAARLAKRSRVEASAKRASKKVPLDAALRPLEAESG